MKCMNNFKVEDHLNKHNMPMLMKDLKLTKSVKIYMKEVKILLTHGIKKWQWMRAVEHLTHMKKHKQWLIQKLPNNNNITIEYLLNQIFIIILQLINYQTVKIKNPFKLVLKLIPKKILNYTRN